MRSVVWVHEEIFDPRQLNRQTYVKSVIADKQVRLSRDAIGVLVHVDHEGEEQEIIIPWDNVRQTLNVRPAGKSGK